MTAPASAPPTTFHSHRPAVRRVAIARAVSITGGEAAYVGIVSLVLARTHSLGWVSGVLLVWIGTSAVVAPFAGALGDRLDRRRVMIASDLAGAACFVAIALAHTPTAILVLAGLAAVCEAPFVPAASAAIPNLTPEEDLVWANGLVGAGRTVGSVAGPVLGGVTVAALGSTAAFGLNAASFLVSAALVASVHGSFTGSRSGAGERHTGVMAGFRFVIRSPFLRTLTIAWSLFLVGIGVLIVAELPLAQVLGADTIGYGFLVAGWGAGGLLGNGLARHGVRWLGELRLVVVGAGAGAAAISAVSVAPALPVAVTLMALAGLCNSASSVAEETIVQRTTPDAVRSRVLAAQEALLMGALGIGLVLGGPLVGGAGARVGYAFAGLLGLTGSSLLAVLLRRRPPDLGPVGS
jgi:MFS family permease